MHDSYLYIPLLAGTSAELFAGDSKKKEHKGGKNDQYCGRGKDKLMQNFLDTEELLNPVIRKLARVADEDNQTGVVKEPEKLKPYYDNTDGVSTIQTHERA